MFVIFLENRSKLSDYLNKVLHSEALSCFNINSYEALETTFLTRDFPEPDIVVLDQDFEAKLVPKSMELIRSHWTQVKIMVLTEVQGAGERVRFLELGADECMSKPIDVKELLLRLKLLYGRNYNYTKAHLNLHSNTRIDDKIKDVLVSGKRLDLNHKEYLLAETFLGHPGKVYSKIILLDLAWDIHTEVESNVVEVTVCSLRKKLERANSNVKIKSRRNVGYWMENI